NAMGHRIIPAEAGELASGLEGEGRMAEPEHILDYIENAIQEDLKLSGKKVLITAGPTYEAIDPVRFIGNHSSGKMGFALAETAAKYAAKVVLVTGPTHLKTDENNIKTIRVSSTDEMFRAVQPYFKKTDIFIAAAAVSDYKPKTSVTQKI